MKLILKIIVIYALIQNIQNAKILGVFPAPSKSHYILGSTLMNALAEKGHDVTMIAPFEQKNLPKNGTYREFILTGWFEDAEEQTKILNLFQFNGINGILTEFIISYGSYYLCESFFNHPNAQKLIHLNETFDIVILEQIRGEALSALASHFNASLVSFSPIGASDIANELVGNPAPLSYIPDFFTNFSSNMTFSQRLLSYIIHSVFILFKYAYKFPQQAKILKKYLPNSPDFYDVIYNSSLILLNSHPSFSQPVPHVPNMIEIGGFHVKPPKRLPKDLQEFLDFAKNGAIYFCMGSKLKSVDLPIQKRQTFLKVFSKLKQKILWKWEEDELPEKPKNVKIKKWLPQQDILAHSNIKLFITHGGLLSTIESIYHGVPILAIPIVNDQGTNAMRAVTDGYALKLDFSDITEEKLTEAINELLNNPKYAENAKFRSNIFHDRQIKPIDKAIYWVEYIARHKEINHLKDAGLKMPWYKYYLLDIITFIALIVITFNVFLFLIVKMLCIRKNQKLIGR